MGISVEAFSSSEIHPSSISSLSFAFKTLHFLISSYYFNIYYFFWFFLRFSNFLYICPSVLAFSLLYFLVPLPFNHICFKFPVSEFLSLMVLALALSPQIVFFAFEYAL